MVGFDEQDARRVAEATRTVEAMTGIPDRGLQAVPVWHERPAVLTGLDGSGRYGWDSLEFTADLDATANSEWLSADCTGEHYAVEFTGCKHALIGDRVLLKPAVGQSYFVFEYHRTASGVTSGGISARSGSAPGDGTVTVESYDASTDTLSAGSQSVPVKNSYRTAVDPGATVRIEIGDGGHWWVQGEDCED